MPWAVTNLANFRANPTERSVSTQAGLVEAVPPGQREVVPAARWPDDVYSALGADGSERRLRPRIFHVSAHGVTRDAWWHAGAPSGSLLFNGGSKAGGAALPGRDEVVDALKTCGDGLELVFFNACK